MANHINEEFFDTETREKYYVSGAFSGSCAPGNRGGFIFRSKTLELVSIVKEKLEADYVINKDDRVNSYWIEVRSHKNLSKKLEELGLIRPKEEKRFSKKVPRWAMQDYVRGILDSEGNPINDRIYTQLQVRLNRLFIMGLHKALRKHAGVERDFPKNIETNAIDYAHNDTMKICDFIYYDFESIEKNRLYVPSKKVLLDSDYVAEGVMRNFGPQQILARNRLKKAKRFLRETDKPIGEISERVGYKDIRCLGVAFTRKVGMSPRDYRKGFRE